MSTYSNIMTTDQRRAVLKNKLDNFATFSWRGQSSYDNYGAFIINDKTDLKFYNGPQFSNEYSSPQYQTSATNLLGMSFKTQTLDFKVGVYWVTADEYQKFIEWISPYQIDYLTFDFCPKYSYLVKLSSISDSTRHILGKDENGEYRYYTELSLKWDLQGPAGARATEMYEYVKVNFYDTDSTKYEALTFVSTSDYEKTKISTPLMFSCHINLKPKSVSSSYGTVTLKLYTRYGITSDSSKQQMVYYTKNDEEVAYYTDYKVDTDVDDTLIDNSVIQLFSITLENLTDLSDSNLYDLDITYDSEAGILYQTFADGTRKILNLLSATTEGDNIVQAFFTNKFKLPGILENPNFDMYNTIFYWQIIAGDNLTVTISDPAITCYGRTNVI